VQQQSRLIQHVTACRAAGVGPPQLPRVSLPAFGLSLLEISDFFGRDKFTEHLLSVRPRFFFDTVYELWRRRQLQSSPAAPANNCHQSPRLLQNPRHGHHLAFRLVAAQRVLRGCNNLNYPLLDTEL